MPQPWSARASGPLLVPVLVIAALAADISSELRSADPERRLIALREIAEDGGEVSRATARRVERLLVKDPRPDIRGAAALALATAMGDDAAKPLLAAVVDERDDEVAVDLVRAFASVPGDDVRRRLSDLAFDADDHRAACLAAEALGHLPESAGRDDLLALLATAPHWAISAGTCLGLGEHREARVVDALVPRLRHPDAAMRSAARDALVRVTGVDHGVDPRAWSDWWRAERETFVFPDRVGDALPTPSTSSDGGETSDDWAAGNRPTFARFFGIPLRGRRICFVIDFSQSMWGPRRNRAQQELIDAVKGLSSATTFGVILFNEDVWWFGDGPMTARPQQKLDLAAYLPEQETKSYTNIYDALERALGLLGVGAQAVEPAPGLDEIVLLSDGVPNRGKIKDTERILEAIATLNAGRVRIHTISLGDEEHDLLPALAEQNRGQHVSHPFAK